MRRDSLRWITRMTTTKVEAINAPSTDALRYQHGGSHPSKISQVAPAAHNLNPRISRRRSTIVPAVLEFSHAFGLFGPPMVAVLLVCIAWTTWEIALTLKPNQTANFLMNTADYDYGYFWQIVDHTSPLKCMAVAGLIVIDLSYVLVLGNMTVWRGKQWCITDALKAKLRIRTQSSFVRSRHMWTRQFSCGCLKVVAFWGDLTSISGRNRKVWNVAMKIMDLVAQSVQLLQILEYGFPIVLVRGYALFLCCNSLSCTAVILLSQHSAVAEIIIDSVFDLVSAIVYPICVLVYCYANFDFDRQSFALGNKLLPHGSFEHIARMKANPSEIVFFRSCFDSLRILSVGALCLRLCLNLFFCSRFQDVVTSLVREPLVGSSHATTVKAVTSSVSGPQRRVPKLVAALFIAFGTLSVAFTERAMSASNAVCAAYPQCLVYAYRWSAPTTCPCLAMVAADRSPRTFADWMQPTDVTDFVRILSTSGDLRVLHLVNYGLSRMPDELRACRSLQYLSLIYTGLVEVPSWANEFKSLEYLHIEGKLLFANLQTLDDGLFFDMPQLTYLHIAVHSHLRALPRLDGAPNLQTLVLAYLFAVKELPSVDSLHSLRRLELVNLPRLRSLPDLSPLLNLVAFTIVRRTELCCNGFLGVCDLTDPLCSANAKMEISAATCLNADESCATVGTKKVMTKFASSTCIGSEFDAKSVDEDLSATIVDICGGVLYRRCEYPDGSGSIGICYNNRMQVLTCIPSPEMIQFRRAQIELGIGAACDPAEEGWLGCQ